MPQPPKLPLPLPFGHQSRNRSRARLDLQKTIAVQVMKPQLPAHGTVGPGTEGSDDHFIDNFCEETVDNQGRLKLVNSSSELGNLANAEVGRCKDQNSDKRN